MKKSIYLFCLLIVTGTGCYYDIEAELYPGNPAPCEAVNVTYTATIQAILNNNGCTGCHSGGAPSGNVSLQDYNNVKVHAASGRLVGAINHSPGFSPMPQGGAKISQCEIDRVKAWVDAGAPNN